MTTQRPVWIIGGYQSDFARNFTKESLEIGDLVRETTTGTLGDAGICAAQVQVVHVGNALGELYVRQGHLGSMVASVVPELSGVPATRHEAACASGGVAVMAAMADLESGRYDVALVLGVEIERNVSGAVGAGHLACASWVGHEGEGQDYVWPFTFSQIAHEYDRRYGLRDEHLRRIAAEIIEWQHGDRGLVGQGQGFAACSQGLGSHRVSLADSNAIGADGSRYVLQSLLAHVVKRHAAGRRAGAAL